MHLIQILLPLQGAHGAALPAALFAEVRRELVARFGGLTAYTRTPAKGLWVEEEGDAVVRDDIVVYEVMVAGLDRAWWAAYREALEARFDQQELVVRAQVIERL